MNKHWFLKGILNNQRLKKSGASCRRKNGVPWEKPTETLKIKWIYTTPGPGIEPGLIGPQRRWHLSSASSICWQFQTVYNSNYMYGLQIRHKQYSIISHWTYSLALYSPIRFRRLIFFCTIGIFCMPIQKISGKKASSRLCSTLEKLSLHYLLHIDSVLIIIFVIVFAVLNSSKALWYVCRKCKSAIYMFSCNLCRCVGGCVWGCMYVC